MCDTLGVGIGGCVAAVRVVAVVLESFDMHLRASDALNIGERIGILLYVALSDLMAFAQTRSHGQSSLKWSLDA